MDNEYDSDLSSEDEVGLIENLVYLRWKPKHDQSPFVGNEKRVICAIKTSENIVDIYLHSSFTCLEFYDVNFNNYPISFWQTQGSRMKSLKLDHCIVDLNTLTCIVEYCANLRAFEFRTSDLFIRDENASFGIVLNRLIEQRLEVPSVETLILEMDKSQNSACSMDQSILNMLLLFPNLKKLTLIHNCELRNFPNYSPIKISDSAESDGRTWDQILNLLVSRLPRFEAINLEFGSIVFSRSVWDHVMHNRNKLRRLKELTFELVPSEQRYPEIKNWYTFLVSQRKLKTITCKLRLESSPIESDFLNKFLRHILKKCSSLQHLKVEQLKLDMGQPHSRWDMDYEFLRDVLASNLKSIQIRVECCDLYLNDDKSELEPWWNDTVELLSLNYARSAPNGRQHATMALFLSKFTSLKHLHLNGDINDVVLNAIWTHQHNLEGLALYFSESSVVTTIGFTGEHSEIAGESSANVTGISKLKNLEYLKLEVQKVDTPALGLELPPKIFAKFKALTKLRFLCIKSNNTNPQFLITLSEQLYGHEALKGLYIGSKVEKMIMDFWNNFSRYCPNLRSLYIKDNCKNFSTHDYKNLFRYCTSLKLLIHENEKQTSRWFIRERQTTPVAERIMDDDKIYLIAVDHSNVYPEFW